jgi:hypothetical protein
MRKIERNVAVELLSDRKSFTVPSAVTTIKGEFSIQQEIGKATRR